MKYTLSLLKLAFKHWRRDHGSILTASLSFYTILWIFPIITIVLSITGQIIGSDTAFKFILKQISVYLNPDMEGSFRILFKIAAEQSSRFYSYSMAAILFFAALGAFSQLTESLDIIFKEKKLKHGSILNFLRTKFFSALILIGLGILMVLLNLMEAGAHSAIHYIHTSFPEMAGHFNSLPFWNYFSYTSSIIIFTLICGIIYRWVPQNPPPFRDVWVGALFSTSMFFIGRIILVIYLKMGSITSFYGMGGAFFIFFFWIYFISFVILFGAEVAWASHQTRKNIHA